MKTAQKCPGHISITTKKVLWDNEVCV